ncbi:MAG TPA: cytochrome c [Nitrospiraceae bacterium]|nr:cytochrome c [Nitrospiraceae bacterium]
MRRVFSGLIVATAAVISPAWIASSDQEAVKDFGAGRPATPEEIRAWNIDVSPSGEGLPPGRGTVEQGARIFAVKCAGCHGATGTEGPKDRLVGGRNTLASREPIKTIGSYWPYATTLYDYIYRAMPFTAPQSLSPDETYSVVAWLLYQNGIIDEGMVIDARSLPTIAMPNRDGFIPDRRPDVPTHQEGR